MHQFQRVENRQIVRFAITGGFGILIYLASLYFLTEAGVWYILSAFIAFIIYFGISFPVQKFWVFQNMEREYLNQQLILYSVVAGLNWIINTFLLYRIVEYFHLWYFGVQLTLTITVSPIAFYIFLWIFRHHR